MQTLTRQVEKLSDNQALDSLSQTTKTLVDRLDNLSENIADSKFDPEATMDEDGRETRKSAGSCPFAVIDIKYIIEVLGEEIIAV